MRRLPRFTPPRLRGLIRWRNSDAEWLIATGLGIYVLLVAGVALVPSVRAWFAWVPVDHGNRVIDAALTVLAAAGFLILAAAVVLPLSLVIHQLGHALGGHLIGMRVIAIRVGPVLLAPSAIVDRVTLLPVRGWDDILVSWSQFDDTPVPTWRRERAWQVVLASGPGLNLAASFTCSLTALLVGPVAYVIFREFVWINLLLCIAALIPITVRGVPSDGKRLLTLLLDERGAVGLLDQLRDEVVVGPVRPAGWPRERIAAWEARIRQTPLTAEGREEQLELAIYLTVNALDRADDAAAWQWLQALSTLLAADPDQHHHAAETARIVLALHAARWERDGVQARVVVEAISKESDIAGSPWHAVARAAVRLCETESAASPCEEAAAEAYALAMDAKERLQEPARLHGLDRMMLGIAAAIESEADRLLRRIAYEADAARETRAA